MSAVSRLRSGRTGAGLCLGLLVALGAACSKCGRAEAPAVPIERLLPKGAVAVVVAPRIDALGDRLRLLESLKIVSFLAPVRGFADAQTLSSELMSQLGVDLRSRVSREAAGLDAQRALGVAVLVSGQAYLVLPVKDATLFEHALSNLARTRLGAGVAGEQKVGAVTVKTFATAAGAPPQAGYVLQGAWALVATGPGVVKLASLAAMTEPDSLATDLVLKASLGRLPATRDLWVWAPHGSPLLMNLPVTSALASLTLTRQALVIDVDAPLKPDQVPPGSLEFHEAPSLEGYLPADAFAVARYAGQGGQAGAIAQRLLGPLVGRAFTEHSFDLQSRVLAHLQPGTVAALSMADRPPLAAGVPTLDLTRTNPFSYAHLSGVGPVDLEAEAATATLEDIAATAPRFGATMKRLERAGTPAFFTTWSQGEGVHFAAKDHHLLFGSPVQRLDALLASEGKGPAPVQDLPAGALSVVLDLGKFGQSVRALPENAWGLGGFAMKGSSVRWLDATDDLKAVRLSISAKEQVAQAHLVLTLQLPAATP